MPRSRGGLLQYKILVVEDNYLIADHVCAALVHHGCEVVGPAGRVAPALELARTAQHLDGAVLDINLDGQLCFPVAAVLAERGVPFVFLTGYDDRAIVPAEFADRPVLAKPLDECQLIEVVEAEIAARPAGEDT